MEHDVKSGIQSGVFAVCPFFCELDVSDEE